MDEFAAYPGIDWADTKHDLCLLDARTGAKTRLVIRHTPEALAEYFTSLRAWFPGRQIAVALEQSRGPLLFALLQYDFLVLFPVNHEQQIVRGKNHQAATRALAYKWIRIIWRCWQTNTPYNEVHYLESLRKKGSPLLAFAAPKPKSS